MIITSEYSLFTCIINSTKDEEEEIFWHYTRSEHGRNLAQTQYIVAEMKVILAHHMSRSFRQNNIGREAVGWREGERGWGRRGEYTGSLFGYWFPIKEIVVKDKWVGIWGRSIKELHRSWSWAYPTFHATWDMIPGRRCSRPSGYTMLCVHQVVGSKPGRHVWFTRAFSGNLWESSLQLRSSCTEMFSHQIDCYSVEGSSMCWETRSTTRPIL